MSATATLFKKSVDPIRTDARDIDTSIGTLTGEAAHQDVKTYDPRLASITPKPWPAMPMIEPSAADATYYDRPMIKPPVWSADIPLYFYVGGAAGACCAIAAAARASGDPALKPLIRQCHWMALIGCGVSAALLIHDLGRPSRFMYMLRVFRPTSPMNVGAWILTATGASVTGALLFRGRLGDVATYSAGAWGTALAGYTGVLLSNTAVPVWQESRRSLPALFISSAATSGASLLQLFPQNPRAAHMIAMFGLAGRVAEIAFSQVVEREAGRVPEVGHALKHGLAGVLYKTATVLTTASLLTGVAARGNRPRLAGVLGTAGAVLLRFAVERAGTQSARNPRASIRQQRSGAAGRLLPTAQRAATA